MRQLVLTLATGRYSEVGDFTYPSMKEYARRTNSDFYSITDNLYPKTPLFEKIRIHHFLNDYDQVLYLDVDMIIRKDCPNLFEMISENSFGAYNEGADIEDDGIGHRRELMAEVARAAGIPFEFSSQHRYFNVGVMMVGKEHQCLFEEPTKMIPAVMGEQSYINIMIEKKKPNLYHLPKCFNQMPFNRSRDYLESSYIVHCAGYSFEDRLNCIREIINHWG